MRVLVLIAFLLAPAATADAKPSDLVGKWKLVVLLDAKSALKIEGTVIFEFRDDGSGRTVSTRGKQTMRSDFTWRIEGDTLVMSETATSQVSRLDYKRVGKRLKLGEIGGDGMVMAFVKTK